MSLPAPIYKTRYGWEWVVVNDLWWLTKNYATDKLDDGSDLPEVTDFETWKTLTTPARCWYNNTSDSEFRSNYGMLVNKYAVDEGLMLPCGNSRVAIFNEAVQLRTYLIENGYNWDGTLEGNKAAKSIASSGGQWDNTSTAGHVGNDQGSNNSSGINLFPSGLRAITVDFVNLSIGCWLWLKDDGSGINNDGFLSIRRNEAGISFTINGTKSQGYAVRLVITAREVTFETNGGTAIDDAFWFDDDTIEAPEPPTKEGYIFDGWYSDEALTTPWDFATDTVDADTTLYAGWVERKRRGFVKNRFVSTFSNSNSQVFNTGGFR